MKVKPVKIHPYCSKKTDYDTIFRLAEEGDLHSMLELAHAYKYGIFDDPFDANYIYWLKKFYDSPTIEQFLLEDDDDAEINWLNPFYKKELREDVIEVCICLALYYRYSSQIYELEYAQTCLRHALASAKGESREIEDSDILSIIVEIEDRIKDIKERGVEQYD